jgi:hypothetical protein
VNAVSNAVLIRRRVRDVSQRAVARQLGCSAATVGRMLQGIDQFAALLAALNIHAVVRAE